jgi:hypothetical protein
MTTSATKREDVACRRAPLRRGRPPYRSVAKKAVVTAVLVMIVVLPITTWISSTDNTGSAGAASVRPGGYYVAVYSLPHLPQTIEGRFETWIKHPRKRFLQSARLTLKGLLYTEVAVTVKRLDEQLRRMWRSVDYGVT